MKPPHRYYKAPHQTSLFNGNTKKWLRSDVLIYAARRRGITWWGSARAAIHYQRRQTVKCRHLPTRVGGTRSGAFNYPLCTFGDPLLHSRFTYPPMLGYMSPSHRSCVSWPPSGSLAAAAGASSQPAFYRQASSRARNSGVVMRRQVLHRTVGETRLIDWRGLASHTNYS